MVVSVSVSVAPRVSELVGALRAVVESSHAGPTIVAAADLLGRLDGAVVPHPDDVEAAVAAMAREFDAADPRDYTLPALSAVLGLRAGGPEGSE